MYVIMFASQTVSRSPINRGINPLKQHQAAALLINNNKNFNSLQIKTKVTTDYSVHIYLMLPLFIIVLIFITLSTIFEEIKHLMPIAKTTFL